MNSIRLIIKEEINRLILEKSHVKEKDQRRHHKKYTDAEWDVVNIIYRKLKKKYGDSVPHKELIKRAEKEFDKGYDDDKRGKVEKHGQHVEEDVGGEVPGVELQVAENLPDVVHE